MREVIFLTSTRTIKEIMPARINLVTANPKESAGLFPDSNVLEVVVYMGSNAKAHFAHHATVSQFDMRDILRAYKKSHVKDLIGLFTLALFNEKKEFCGLRFDF